MSDEFLIYGVGAFFLYAASEKTQKWFLAWIESPRDQIALVLIAALLLGILIDWIFHKWSAKKAEREKEAAVLGPGESAVFCGRTLEGEDVFVKTRQRAMHTQVIGTTNAGKTESVILPWAIQDIEQGRGLILIDGKSDRSLLDKLYAYAVRSGREKDFRLFSLSNIEESEQFNPLIGGTPEEISERVFNSFEFDNPYYRSLQFEVFSQVMRIFEGAKESPTFLRIHQAITTPQALVQLASEAEDPSLKIWAEYYRDLPQNDRTQRTSGLVAALSHFAFGKTASLFNTEEPRITLEEALSKNLIVYFQLPVLLSPFLGKASGKMILQSLQSAVANRHRDTNRSPSFYSVFLDDFAEYLYPGFVSILNKSRSANVGVVFAHQALGDIKTLGDAIANSILTNANLKIFMRGNDPDSAEYFAKVIGTVKTTKYTERRKRGLWKEERTGDTSAREVDEFVVHPNRFKSELGVGQAIMVVPHESGSRVVELRFKKYDDLAAPELLPIKKERARGLRTIESRNPVSVRAKPEPKTKEAS